MATNTFNSSDGQVVRVLTSGVVDSGLILSLVKPMTLKLVFTVPCLMLSATRDSVENKQTS